MRKSASKPLIITAAAIVGAVIIVLYATVDPATGWFPRCVFKSVTGLDCPGCGSQRAIHALLGGDIAGAWHFNAMLVAFIPVIALLMVAAANRERWPRFYASVNSRWVIWGSFALIMGWWIYRNL